MQRLKYIFLALICSPLFASAFFAVPFGATSTSQGWIFPSRVNGVEQTIFGQNFFSSSTLRNIFPNASTTNASVSSSLWLPGLADPAGKFLAVDTAGKVITTTTPTTGGVTSVTGSGNIASSGGTTPNITLTGVVPVTNGGIGWAAVQSGTIPYGNGSNALATTTGGTAGQILGLSGGIPTWIASTTYSAPLVFSGNNVTCNVASGSQPGCLSSADWGTFNSKQATIGVTWPITLSGATIGFGGLSTSSPLAAGAAALYATGVNTVASAATSTPAIGSVLNYTGTLGNFIGGSSGTFGIANNGLTLAMFPTIAANTVIGNSSGVTGTPTAVATSSLFAGTAGQVLARVGSTWTGVATTTDSCSTGITCSFSGSTNSFSIQNGAVTNAMLANSTISGIALGGTLNALTATNGTLTFSGSYDGTNARTVGLNLGNANSWTALQQFNANASSTIESVLGPLYVGRTATSTIFGDSATSTLVSSLGVQKTSGTAFQVNDQYGTNIANVSTASTTPGYDLIELWSATSTGPLFGVDQYGHVFASSTVPTLSSCGTDPSLSNDSSDFAGTITVGGVVATACTLTFGTAHVTGTHCVISEQTGSVVNAASYTESLTGFTYSQTGLTSDKLDYICSGK